ncbi:MAG: LysR family transcriptional regulator [Clostridiales bacterium]|nr:LysR family transcriptional regulator [Clostridiales bacterium]
MINEAAIRCFLTLCETLSFTETAKRLFMTQQAVSKYIAKLEEDLGFKLFIRTHHYVMMTKAGENYYELFHRFHNDFLDTTENTRRYYSEQFTSLRVGYLEWLEISAGVTGALKTVKAKNADMKVTIEKYPQQELNELFFQRKLDLIITYAEFAPKGVGIKKLKAVETPLVLLVSPDNPKAVEGATVADFRTEPFIKAAASRETLSESRGRARRQCGELGFMPSEIIISPNLESAYMATALGQGVLVSTMLSRMSLHSELIAYPVGKTEELQCFWHEDQENPAVKEFAEMLEKSY